MEGLIKVLLGVVIILFIMANILDSVIIDPDTALYSDRILGYNNNIATLPDNAESWMTDVWFPAVKTLSWNSTNSEFVNITPISLSNWLTEVMFVGQFGIESKKHGWIYSLSFGGWIYVSTDPYSLYTNLYWTEVLNLQVIDQSIVDTHNNGVPNENNLYVDILLLEAATLSLPGIWVWFETIENDSSFKNGWIFFSRASVGISSNQFNNTGVTGHVNGEGIMGWGIFTQTAQGSTTYWHGGVAFVAGSDGKIRYKSYTQSAYSLL